MTIGILLLGLVVVSFVAGAIGGCVVMLLKVRGLERRVDDLDGDIGELWANVFPFDGTPADSDNVVPFRPGPPAA